MRTRACFRGWLICGLAVASPALVGCSSGTGPDGPPEAVTVEATVDGLTVTVSWNAAAGATSYRAELFGNLPIGKVTTESQILFTEADGVLANSTYTVTVFSINDDGETQSTNSPTVST